MLAKNPGPIPIIERTTMRLITVFICLLISSGSLVAQTQKKTPWGDPDLQGIWSTQTPVPLERPQALAGKATFSATEAAEFEKTSLERLLKGLAAAGQVAVSGELNDTWLETGSGRVPPNRSTSLVTTPADGKIPYTPDGKKRWDAVPKLEGLLAANAPEDRAESERCLTTSGLYIPNPFYNNLHQIFQTQGYVVILTEMMHEVRVVPLDGRAHVGQSVGQWLGDSRGRWEGQTLVIETTNFNDKRLFRGATRNLRLVERLTRLDADTIGYQLEVTDPATFATPWTLQNALRKTSGPLYEVACHEGNYGLAGILSGARAEERK
jgi:hypothetical protein